MRRAVPALGDREQIVVWVVIKGDYATQGVRDGGDMAPLIVVDGKVIAIAIFDLAAAIFIVGFDEAEFSAVRRPH